MQIPTRTFSDLLTEGLNLLQRSWRGLLAPALGASLVLGFISVIVLGVTDSLDFFDIAINDPDALSEMSTDEVWELFRPFVVGFSITTVVQMVAFSFIALASHRVVGSAIAGDEITGAEAARFAASRMVTMLVTGLIAGILIVVGLVLLVAPGLWVAGSLSMITAVVALERGGPADSVRRSFELVRGRWWPTVGFVLLVGLISGFAIQLVQLVALPLLIVGSPGIALGAAYVFGVLIQGMVAAAVSAMVTVWYTDLRTRKEELTTTMLAADAPGPL